MFQLEVLGNGAGLGNYLKFIGGGGGVDYWLLIYNSSYNSEIF